jgi:hypothetical protein
MQAYDVKPDRWVHKLATQLIGKAQQAYTALSTDAAMNYDQVKDAIRRYDVNEETYHRQFRTAAETTRELAVRLG